MIRALEIIKMNMKLMPIIGLSICLIAITAFISPLIPAVIFSLAAVLFILKDYRYGTIVIIVFSFTTLPGQEIFKAFHLLLVVITITSFSFALSYFRGNVTIKGVRQFNFLLVVFGVWAFLSGAIAMDHKFWFHHIEHMFRAFIIFYLIYNSFSSKEDIILVFKIIVLSIFLSSFISFFTSAGAISLSTSNLLPIFMDRFAGTIFDPNYFAMTVAASIPLAAFLIIKEKRLMMKFVWISAILFLIFSIIISQSRTGLFSASVIFIYSTLYLLRRKRKEVLYLFVPLILLVILLPSVFWYRMTLFVESLIHGTRGDFSTIHRLVLTEAAFDVFIKNVLFGVGLGNFEAIAALYTQYPMVCHNTYLEIAANLGLLGLIPFLLILYIGFTILKPAKSNPNLVELAWAIQAGLLGLYVAILFLSVPFKLDLWIFLALSALISRVHTQQYAS